MPIAVDDLVITNESATLNGDVFAANGGAADSDPDNPLVVSHVNGVAAAVGSQITLASGALLTLNADGTFAYDPNGAFDALSGQAAGGGNRLRDDTFTYTLLNGNTATVIVRVLGEDSDGDLLIGNGGDDTLDGGAGRDRLSFLTAPAAVTVDLNIAGMQDTGGAGQSAIVNIEDLTGSLFDDVLTGLDGFGSSLIGLDGNDTLNGGTGDNTLEGGAGDDTLNGEAGVDVAAYTAAGAGVTVDLAVAGAQNTGGAGTDTLTGIEGLTGSAFGDTLSGDGGANTLNGGDGDDTLIGRLGDDTLIGGAGIDTADYSAVGDVVIQVDLSLGAVAQNTGDGMDTLSGVENVIGSISGDYLTGDGAANVLSGGNGEDVLRGNGGNDTLNGGVEFDVLFGDAGDDILNGDDGDDRLFDDAGDDILNGGDGIDIAYYWGATAGVAVDLALSGAQNTGGAGLDTLNSIEWAQGSDFNDVLSGLDGEGGKLYGRAGDDVLNGRGGDDELYGDEGNDVLNGGEGDDLLGADEGNDALNGGAGVDTVDYEGVSGAVFARLGGGTSTDGEGGTDTLTGIENVIGSDQDDVVIGSSAVNNIRGGSGRDVLVGLGGNDILDGGGGDANTLIGGAGDDTYVSQAADTIVELAGEGTDTVETEQAAHTLRANVENLTYTGDTAFVGVGNDQANVITGGEESDVLSGMAGNDSLRGGAGAPNTLIGGTGDDTYFVNSQDTIVERADEGTDRVVTELANYTLAAHVENLSFAGEAGFVGRGNTLGNDITGGAQRDTLLGLAGNDTLRGGTGAANVLMGGTGDDTYVVAAVGDTVLEYAGEGTDTVQTALASHTLRAEVENLTYTGASAFVGVGNAADNVITGGIAADQLSGGGGADTLVGGSGAANTLIGGLGDDLYVVTASDTIVELSGQGTDTVQTDRAFYTLAANIENLTFTGTGAFQGTGNALANVITGGAGGDTLIGGQGDDTLIDGGGLDYLVLTGVLADYTVTDLGGGGYRIVDAVGGRDGTDVTTGVERVRFATGPTVALASLAGGGAPLQPVDKTDDAPQVLPGLSDDDFVLAKDADAPEVLPGAEDDASALFDLFEAVDLFEAERGPLTGRWMLSLDPEQTAGPAPDDLAGVWSLVGWGRDDWSA